MKTNISEESNLIQTIKNKFNFASKTWFYEIVIYFFIGFVLGLLLKYFGRIIAILIFLSASLWLLEFFGFIDINYNLLTNFLKVSPQTSFSDIISLSIDWIKSHIAQCIALAFGIYLAWELM